MSQFKINYKNPWTWVMALWIMLMFTWMVVALATAPPASGQPDPPPGGDSPDGPKLAPPYRPSEGRRPTILLECHPIDPGKMVLTFQPWNDEPGWLELTDVHGEYNVPAHFWASGESYTLPNRQGMKLTYWSGSSDDPEHPGARDGVYVYNLVHGRCDPLTTTTAPPPPTTTTTTPDPTTTTVPEPTTTTAPEPTTTTVEPVRPEPTTIVPPTPTTAAETEIGSTHIEATQPTARRSMPVTGASLGLLALVALAFVAIGVWLTRHGR